MRGALEELGMDAELREVVLERLSAPASISLYGRGGD